MGPHQQQQQQLGGHQKLTWNLNQQEFPMSPPIMKVGHDPSLCGYYSAESWNQETSIFSLVVCVRLNFF